MTRLEQPTSTLSRAGPTRSGPPRRADAARRCCFSDVGALPVERPTTLLAKDLLNEGETIILMLRPSAMSIALSSVGGLIIIALVTFALAYMARLSWAGWNDRQAFGLGIGLSTLHVGWQLLEWVSRTYVLTDRRVICRSGVLRVSVFERPLKQIQHVSLFASFRERIFGLGTIGFAAADSHTFEAFWSMIRNPRAAHQVVVDAIQRYGR